MFICQLYDLIELVEVDEEVYINDFVFLLKVNEYVLFVVIYSMKYLYRKEYEVYICMCINYVLEKYSNYDYFKFYVVYVFFKFDDSKGVFFLLYYIDNKKYSFFYYYFKGRIVLDEEKYDEVVEVLCSLL